MSETGGEQLQVDVSMASKLIIALNECSEWYQVYILEALMNVIPPSPDDALLLAERVASRLQHSNAAVSLTVLRVLLYMLSYLPRDNPQYVEPARQLGAKIVPPLVTLMSRGPEIQYTALRNILLIVESYPGILVKEVSVFFVKYTDPIYVKLAKLEILVRLVTPDNCSTILSELREYATEVDVEFVRRAVKYIGRCALQVESMADACMHALQHLISTKVSYVLQEAVVVVRDMFRRYPGKYEGMLGALTDQLEAIDEPDARAAYIWILGHYSTRIEGAADALRLFIKDTLTDPPAVQLAYITAVAKAAALGVPGGPQLLNELAAIMVHGVDNPDVRDRMVMYQRLIETHPASARVVLGVDTRPVVSPASDAIPGHLRQELLMHVGALASVLHRPPAAITGKASTAAAAAAISSSTMQRRASAAPSTGAGQAQQPMLPSPHPPAAGGVNLLDLDDSGAAPYVASSGISASPSYMGGFGSGGGGISGSPSYGGGLIHTSPSNMSGLGNLGSPSYHQGLSSIAESSGGGYAALGNNYNASPTSPPLAYMPMQPSPVPSQPGSPPRPASASLSPQSPPIQLQQQQQQQQQQPLNVFGNTSPGTNAFNFAFSTDGVATKAMQAITTSAQQPDAFGMLQPMGTQPQQQHPYSQPAQATNPFGTAPAPARSPSPPQQRPAPIATSNLINPDIMNSLAGLSLASPIQAEPPREFLTSSAGHGLSISGTVQPNPSSPGDIYMDVTLTNKSLAIISGPFLLKFNNNVFGLQFRDPTLPVQSLAPNQSQQVRINLVRGPVGPCQESVIAAPLHFQAAIKASHGLYYFFVPIKAHLVMVDCPNPSAVVPDLVAMEWLKSTNVVNVMTGSKQPGAVVARLAEKLAANKVMVTRQDASSAIFVGMLASNDPFVIGVSIPSMAGSPPAITLRVKSKLECMTAELAKFLTELANNIVSS
ncbi:adaptin N terminal region-domain-containing protein [Catenaria anguillulae PL171]|uniref:Adaptin N terminal region-domain-containing protein n=1 Tax=Catenaria anguillulae PL171 TaxID=765915 RepID=A0A1Y2HPE9_9FUNG|nr:adaptin N terminal region-domain-containing protein [Catenaria anguillulae PL171]